MTDENLTSLTPSELEAIRSLVEALVARNPEHPHLAAAIREGGDPWEPTRGWVEWDQVDLVTPAGAPSLWRAWLIRGPEGWTAVDLPMWTVQEGGESELVLHVDVRGSDLIFRGMWS